MASLEEKPGHDHLEEKGNSHVGVTYVGDAELEKRITRKLDLHILPWIFVLWLLAFIDRSNIGKREWHASRHMFVLTREQAMQSSMGLSMTSTSPETATTLLLQYSTSSMS